MSPLVLDIETVPLESALAVPYPEQDRNPPANYKSEEAITRWRETDRARWEQERAKDCSLNPRLGRILCIGTSEGLWYAETPEAEIDVLQNVWARLSISKGRVATWNGSWDLRFILLRSMHLQLEPPVPGDVIASWFQKYRYAPHFDCKAALMNWEVRAAEGLGDWARFLGLQGKTDGLSGADVYPLFLAGHHSEIADYCAQDVRATQDIYRRIVPLFTNTPF